MNSFSSLCKHWRLIRLWNTNIFTKDRKHYLKTFTYTSSKFSQVNFFIKTTKQIRSKHFTHSSLNILRIKPRSLKRTPGCHYSHLHGRLAKWSHGDLHLLPLVCFNFDDKSFYSFHTIWLTSYRFTPHNVSCIAAWWWREDVIKVTKHWQGSSVYIFFSKRRH